MFLLAKFMYSIENLKHNKMLDPLGQAWQSGSVLAAQTRTWPCICKQTTSMRFPIGVSTFLAQRLAARWGKT